MVVRMRSAGFPPRRPARIVRYIAPTVLTLMCFYYWSLPRSALTKAPVLQRFTPPPRERPYEHSAWQQQWRHEGQQPIDQKGQLVHTATPKRPAPKPAAHPIDSLISAAKKTFNHLLAKQTRSIGDAAALYRKRRGRHPPPGFDVWFVFAQENNAIIIEEFWDQIYDDLEPFWALPARQIRKEAMDFEMTINVRNGNASAQSDWFWTQIWLKLIKSIEHMLPDMDLALNAMDEPRMVVPWETMEAYMMTTSKSAKLPDAESVEPGFERLPPVRSASDPSVKLPDKDWEDTRPFWAIARRGCAPASPARNYDLMTGFDHAPQMSASFADRHMHKGFVSNTTLSADICHQPDLQGLQGIFVEPLSVSSTKTLFPLFGGSKLTVNNDILLPAPMYWSEEERFTGGKDRGTAWADKKDQVVWRGVATGGKNTESNWKAFQRHRFVAMNNATKLAAAEASTTTVPANFALPSELYNIKAQRAGQLSAWVKGWANVSFTDLMCSHDPDQGRCQYTSPFFSVEQPIKMADQFSFKYVPDIDGNSFSGRYLGFLRSTSLPIKATIWREWHDSRLVAWKHFVPMDSRYGDWFGIMQYFLGYDKTAGHDAAAAEIANSGKEWAEKVLRKEDMQIYVLRLLLEYARVSDERREAMGWVADLLLVTGSSNGQPS